MELTQEQCQNIYNQVLDLMGTKGVKGLVMDTLASRCGMSKRTLYEIFDSKQRLIADSLDYHFRVYRKDMEEIFNSSDNVMSAMIAILDYHMTQLNRINASLLEELSVIFPALQDHYRTQSEEHHRFLIALFDRGVKEGVFRKTVDTSIKTRILEIQLESLRRMEGSFAAKLDPGLVYYHVIIGFLRSIASPRGAKIIEEYVRNSEEKILGCKKESHKN